MDVFKVLEPGPLTTVQDGGRYGYQQFGIPLAGALDQFAYRVANILVGNPEGAAVLECTVLGPRLEVITGADIALTGAEMQMTVNGEPIESWQAIQVKPGDVVRVGQIKSGCRSYLAVTGGIDVPLLMGSRSTYAGASIGGYHGRPLARGDTVARGDMSPRGVFSRLPDAFIPTYHSAITLRAVPGPQDDYFDEASDVFFSEQFTVDSKADRMGYRLQGPTIVHREGVTKSIISEPCLPGGVQIPPDGQAIILLVEQTVGGYAKIATVISTDIPKVAQAKPGDLIRFTRVKLDAAHKAYRERQKLLEGIREKLLMKRFSA
jgi:biotin-dependent carboxylase-like uncharacterized protein